MRLIGTLDPQLAERFSFVLQREKVAHQIDEKGSVWIVNEDELDKATELLKRFQEHPDDFQIHIVHPPKAPRKAPLTIFIVAVAAFLFLVTAWTEPLMEA